MNSDIPFEIKRNCISVPAGNVIIGFSSVFELNSILEREMRTSAVDIHRTFCIMIKSFEVTHFSSD